MTEHLDKPEDLEIESISGHPSPSERAAIEMALKELIESEHRSDRSQSGDAHLAHRAGGSG